jgi:hypothetical protein
MSGVKGKSRGGNELPPPATESQALPEEVIDRLLGTDRRFLDTYWEDLIEKTRARHGVLPEFESQWLSPPPHIKLKKPKRKRGWHSRFVRYSGNTFWACADDVIELSAAKAACNRLTPDARKKGAQANSTKAAQVRAKLRSDFGSVIATLPPRGISRLAKSLAPVFGLGVSTMRKHIVAVRELLTSR